MIIRKSYFLCYMRSSKQYNFLPRSYLYTATSNADILSGDFISLGRSVFIVVSSSSRDYFPHFPSNIFLFFSVSASFMRNVYPSSVSCKVFSLDVFQVFLHPLRYIFHCFAYYFAKLASSLSFLFLITSQVITNFWRRDSC